MKIRLRNGKLTVDGYEPTKDVEVKYSFELGTNHLTPILTVSDGYSTISYKGSNPVIDMDYDCKSDLTFKVDLVDSYNHVIKTYTNTFKFLKYYSLDGRMDYIDVYEENKHLKKKIEKLEDEGGVI